MMLTTDRDSYYSPPEVADALAASLRKQPHTVLDSNCGRGALLSAIERVHPFVQCAGIDADSSAIQSLRVAKPHWNLVEGDSLKQGTWDQMRTITPKVDLTVLNPPFSMGYAKGIQLSVAGVDIRCSLAMAHLLKAVEQCCPERILAVLPESLLGSELDAYGRALLEQRYEIGVVAAFRNSAFKGARAHAALVVFEKIQKIKEPQVHKLDNRKLPGGFEIVRGGLPVFEARVDPAGLPYIHTTNLHELSKGLTEIKRVCRIKRGVVEGSVLLLPRVGLPSKDSLPALDVPSVQLSDCVIALKFPKLSCAEKFRNTLFKNWSSFISCYSGTGARYTTLARLRAINFDDEHE